MLIIPANSASAAGGFDVANSCRFDGSSSYLHKTPTNAGNRLKYTFSTWVKKSKITGEQIIFTAYASNTNHTYLRFKNTGEIRYRDVASDSTNGQLVTSAKFRDPSAWLNVVLVVDEENSTSGNRLILYVNGLRVTEFSTETMPTAATTWNSADVKMEIGVTDGGDGDDYFSGYMAETVFIDGSALAPTDFGEFDEDSGIWKPIKVSGLTFGTNGFYLDFKSSGNLGNDANGGTDLTETGLAAIDQSTDTPTNNFATFKSNHPAIANTAFSEGSLQFSSDGNVTTQAPASSSIAVSTGKWYAEFKVIAESTRSGSYSYVGVAGTALWVSAANNSYYIGGQADAIGYNGNAAVYSATNEVDGSETNYANGNIVGVAADFTNSKIYFSVNGTYINSGDPAGAANGYDIPATAEGFYYFAVSVFGQNATWQANFGSPPYAISSSNADANDHGNFEYAVPSGFFALNTKNLAEHG